MSINGRYIPYRRRNLQDIGIFEGEEDCESSHGRRLIEKSIPANSEMLITFTNMVPSISLRPTLGAISYNLTSWRGDPLERADV